MLLRAAVLTPDTAWIHARIGRIWLDRLDFARAAAAFDTALRIDPMLDDVRLGLARCWNRLGRHGDVAGLIAAATTPISSHGLYMRGIAAMGLNRPDLAERDFRAALADDPTHREAAFELGRLLRAGNRLNELGDLCDHLWARGARHVQLLLDRGRVEAYAGRADAARDLLFSPGRISRSTLDCPAGFRSLDDFNAGLAAELTTNPYPITDVPVDELAMRGATRIHHLMNGRDPALIRALFTAITACIDRDVARRVASTPDAAHDPWLQCRPARARLRAWGLIQGHGAYEDWHTHRAGWLSGVYYIAIPEPFSEEGDGDGCIEFGAGPSMADRYPETLRVAPRAGMLLLTPSHIHHRTIPFPRPGKRISFAFDVRPLD